MSTQPLEAVTMCLKALYTLLDTSWPRSKLGNEQSLAVELLNVMHRMLLTRETANTHLLVMDVVRQVIKTAQEALATERERQEEG
jgi:hypothetical protein